MATAHPVFSLGKKKAKRDKRNLLLATILKKTAIPSKYDFDTTHGAIPLPMFANDTYGCCVIAGRAHQTLRFELVETGKLPAITDKTVTKEYFRESGGKDSGLVVLDSLNEWRRAGWRVGRQQLKIKAFAEINRTVKDEVMRSVFMDLGVGIGLSLPQSAQTEIDAGQPWRTTSGTGSKPGSWGGHYVYVVGYNPTGPVCITWGRKQQMSWAFWLKYCDEAYAIIDAPDSTRKRRAGINQEALRAYLKTKPIRR